ncbi:MAG: TetR/AcrR family transcriptional regulator [Pseudomonadota bacterium]
MHQRNESDQTIRTKKTNVARRKEAQQKRSHEKVESILSVTLEMLGEGPTERIGTKSIAKAAGVSVGSLYRFFPNKEAIYYELYRRWLAQNLDALDRLIERLEKDATLEQFTDAFLDVMTEPELNSPGNWRLRLAMGTSRKLAELEASHRMEVVHRVAILQSQFGKLPSPEVASDVLILQNEVTIACLFSLAQATNTPSEALIRRLCKTLFLLIFDYDHWQQEAN